ncbi:HepT-like ribonuclease domain-containing protein [Isoptericola sp. 178]|uniref:HepT-like ribonuclease domain-containing protein n=1 Tax=Isoptericola sp. 178 TaxID=3064651 RepID=UPI0027136D03|nr:HepT-like ribonuclease domain-containing protein [Isoptericola sp. 178]MDO8142978.1 DUF86 domain-containing protein [Isoptericola sp. 178]
MSAARRSPEWHVDRALQHVGQLREHLQRGLDLDDPLLQDAVAMQLVATIDALIAAETVGAGEVAGAFGDTWRRMVGMRNVLVHEYAVLDVELLRTAVTVDLTAVEETARALRRTWTDPHTG